MNNITKIISSGDSTSILSLIYNDKYDPNHLISLAIKYSSHDIVNLLLDHGANIETEYEGLLPIMLAIVYDRTDLLQYLLNNSYAYRILICALTYRKLSMMQALVQCGLDIHVKIEDDKNVLHYLAIEGNIIFLTFFLKNGVDVDAKDIDGNTPLIIASKEENINVVELLLKNGANVNIKNKYGSTAIIKAALNNNIYLIKLLLNYGAVSENPRNKFQRLALERIQNVKTNSGLLKL
jgi:ankyrin repeat protein